MDTSKPANLLIVDDEATLLRTLKRVAVSKGYCVTTASNGIQALESFAQALENGQRFDLVITDLTMPNMTGADLLERLRILDPAVKTVLCSCEIEHEIFANFRKYHFVSTLPKPITLENFTKTIQTALYTS